MSEELKLLPIDHPLLKKTPEEFNFEENDAHDTARILKKRMIDLGGVGLSANQIGLDQRAFCIGVRNPVTDEVFERVMFNPLLIVVNDETSIAEEGCLSVPGLRLHVRRPTECTITYYNEKQEQVTEKFLGIAARVALHEYDHMLGKNFMHRVSKLKMQRAIKALDKKVKRYYQEKQYG